MSEKLDSENLKLKDNAQEKSDKYDHTVNESSDCSDTYYVSHVDNNIYITIYDSKHTIGTSDPTEEPLDDYHNMLDTYNVKHHELSDSAIDEIWDNDTEELPSENDIYSSDTTDANDNYTIKKLRKSWKMTHKEFANLLHISAKIEKELEQYERDHPDAILYFCCFIRNNYFSTWHISD